jgi:hypothetical protein
MKINPSLLSILVLAMSCHSPVDKPAPAPVQLIAFDTTKALSQPNLHPKYSNGSVSKTHLRDTTYAVGNFILFLEPDDERYAELEKDPDAETAEGDADFGAGISGTEDSLKTNDRYKAIKLLVSTHRYISIKDCKDGPLIIDRDSVSYGFILSAKGKPIAVTYNSVHSGNYLGELDDYFSLR